MDLPVDLVVEVVEAADDPDGHHAEGGLRESVSLQVFVEGFQFAVLEDQPTLRANVNVFVVCSDKAENIGMLQKAGDINACLALPACLLVSFEDLHSHVLAVVDSVPYLPISAPPNLTDQVDIKSNRSLG